MILEVMKMTSFLDIIFKRPALRDVKNKLREKFGYLPLNNPDTGDYSKPIIDPPFVPPIFYHIRASLMRQF